MANLQKANLGTPPAGVGGDDQRAANTKFNANVDVLNAQAAIVSAVPITSNQALGDAHIGKRVSINIAAGGTVKLGRAAQYAADSVVWLVNIGAKRVLLAPGDGSGDTVGLSGLNPGEAAVFDTDGVKTWRVLMRGRASGDDESINGALSVGGTLSVGGGVAGDLPATGKVGGMAGANLLVNGSGELGNIGWNGSNFTADRDSSGGNGSFFRNAVVLNGSPLYNYSDYLPATPGLKVAIQGIVGSAGMTAGGAAIGVEFVDASNVLLSVISPAVVPFGNAPTFRTATGTAPTGTVKMRFRIGVTASPAGPVGAASYANLKYELGTSISAYSQEATLAYLAGAPALAGRPTFAGKVPWDSGNLDPSNYIARRASNDIAGTYFASGTMPTIAGIDAARQDACLTIANNRNSSASAVVQFHREGNFAAYFGLDTDNYWKVGGRSMGANAYRIVHEGIDGATLGGWLQLNGAKVVYLPNYGYLSQGGAGVSTGAGGNVGVALHCPNGRIVAAEFDAVSDARLKTDIAEIDPNRAIDFVRNVDPVSFRWVGEEGGPDAVQNFGFLAQAVGMAGFPELLRLASDQRVHETVDDDGWTSPEGVRFSLNYDQVIPIHSSVLRSLLRRMAEVEASVAELWSRA
ncbi:tail fiber domain-containing protein [Burkholderia diffusa]|uniref:tail fiber domain-containing protein n=1 Tax=Burkholderia diffusa TaxID=488732 RepID=UPI001581EFC4|nr:tail fiber domain-containing protein [Burkholderia diffusa]